MIENINFEIKKFIADRFLFGDDHKLIDNSSLIDDGIVDSTGILELVTFIEETFEIKVNDDELVPENLDSIAKISAFVIKKKQLS